MQTAIQHAIAEIQLPDLGETPNSSQTVDILGHTIPYTSVLQQSIDVLKAFMPIEATLPLLGS
jgi:hypothetical protein